MNYYSLNNKAHIVSFKEAVINGIAPDRGLYFPQTIHRLPTDFFEKIADLSNPEIAFEVIRPFVGDDIPEKELKAIISETLNFDFPCIEVENNIYVLELFHGPTLAFKDVGARFMSRCLGYFNRNSEQKNTILVATSGDTGGAVANGFLGVKGVDVVILYPSGKVSDIQEKQLTTLGNNITALEVDGTFDDCQDMVKTAFLDTDLRELNLTSANSINIARWLPQMFYFFFAYKQLKKYQLPITVSCPSGNFGNICAGMLAKKTGLPIHHFVAATNSNDVVPQFMQTGIYEAKPSKSTISNAMDVGNPSNFIRILELYHHNLNDLRRDLSSYSFTDSETATAMKKCYNTSGYILEPHGAVGYLGLKKALNQHEEKQYLGLFLETAHPVKFPDIVERELMIELTVPEQIQDIMDKKKVSHKIQTYEELKKILLT